MALQHQYDNIQVEIRQQLKLLVKKLDKHQVNQKQNPKNWGYLGDLQYINEKLTLIHEFFK